MADIFFKHSWAQGKDIGMGHSASLHNTWLCRNCGMLRNMYNVNNACKGKVRVETRNEHNK